MQVAPKILPEAFEADPDVAHALDRELVCLR